MYLYKLAVIALVAAVAGRATAQPQKKPVVNGSKKGLLWEVGAGYNGFVATGAHNGLGFMNGMQGYAAVRLLKKRLLLGAEAGYAAQAPHVEDKELDLGASMGGSLGIKASNALYNLGINSRYNIIQKQMFNWYITAGGGILSVRSKAELYNLNINDECKVLERNRLLRDRTWYHFLGTGFNWVTGLLKDPGNEGPGGIVLNVSVRYLHTGIVEAMNIRDLHHRDAIPTGDGRPLNVSFIDLRTNTLHTHKVAMVREAPLRGIMLNVGCTFNFGH